VNYRPSQIVIGTAGHIDHGKTALVKALTGTDTDRLEEEKARGMTIDLGFAFLDDNITIIDVPGHEKFIRNMVAGVSTIHIALLVVAADDGIMPQTREHLQIISLLQIPRGVIALTKVDLVDDEEWIDMVEEEIRETVKGTFLESAPIIRTSVKPETGIAELRAALLEQAAAVQLEDDRGFFRLPIDRVFIKTGFGTVVTGTVIAGQLSVGEELVCLPVGIKGKVRGLQSHGKNVPAVVKGDRAAVNLAGVDKQQLWRGSELVTPGWLESTRHLIARVTLVSHTRWRLKTKQRIRVHIGTAQVLGRIQTVSGELKGGQSGNIIIHLEKPMVAAMDDRFVLRSYSPMETIGGGQILDPQPVGKWKTIKDWASKLKTPINERFNQYIERFRDHPRTVAEWSRVFHHPEAWIRSLIETNGLSVVPENDLVFKPEDLEWLTGAIEGFLNDFHRDNPYRVSVSGEVIKQEFGLSDRWGDWVLDNMVSKGIIVGKDAGYALAGHQIALTGEDQRKADAISDLLYGSRFMSLKVTEIASATNLDEQRVVELLHVLKNQGRVMEIQRELWLDCRRFDELIAEIRRFFDGHSKLTVPDFKDITSLTRKTAIPLLEYLDARGFTEREGNERIRGEKLDSGIEITD